MTTTEQIPADTLEELADLADLLPVGAPLPYIKAKLLVLAWTSIEESAMAWSGANLVLKVDPAAYQSGEAVYECPDMGLLDFSVDLWLPFSDDWRIAESVDLFSLAIFLKIKVGTWGTTPIARRRHVTRDRLDGLGLGCLIHPHNATATLYLSGDRSLIDIIHKDLQDQIR